MLLYFCVLGDIGAISIFQSLKSNFSMRVLNLSKNCLTEKSCHALKDYLQGSAAVSTGYVRSYSYDGTDSLGSNHGIDLEPISPYTDSGTPYAESNISYTESNIPYTERTLRSDAYTDGDSAVSEIGSFLERKFSESSYENEQEKS